MISPAIVLDGLDWPDIAARLHSEGYALLPGLLSPSQTRSLTRLARAPVGLRRESPAGHGLGGGELLYFDPAMPRLLADWRACFYQHLAPLADRWSSMLGHGERHPPTLEEFLRHSHRPGDGRQLSHLSRLGPGAHLVLHQRNEGRHVFALQIVALLSTPDVDFSGGEFVMTERRPRMQSRPIVLPLRRGDAAIICTAVRPAKGNHGHYRADLRHAISPVHTGERIGLELSFHDAP